MEADEILPSDVPQRREDDAVAGGEEPENDVGGLEPIHLRTAQHEAECEFGVDATVP